MPRLKKKKELVRSLPEESFWIHDGPVVNCLTELADILEYTIPDETYFYHVTRKKNDFADWIELVLHDISAAKAVRKSRTRAGMVRKIRSSLKDYAL
jgi:hypothetical protein